MVKIVAFPIEYSLSWRGALCVTTFFGRDFKRAKQRGFDEPKGEVRQRSSGTDVYKISDGLMLVSFMPSPVSLLILIIQLLPVQVATETLTIMIQNPSSADILRH